MKFAELVLLVENESDSIVWDPTEQLWCKTFNWSNNHRMTISYYKDRECRIRHRLNGPAFQSWDTDLITKEKLLPNSPWDLQYWINGREYTKEKYDEIVSVIKSFETAEEQEAAMNILDTLED